MFCCKLCSAFHIFDVAMKMVCSNFIACIHFISYTRKLNQWLNSVEFHFGFQHPTWFIFHFIFLSENRWISHRNKVLIAAARWGEQRAKQKNVPFQTTLIMFGILLQMSILHSTSNMTHVTWWIENSPNWAMSSLGTDPTIFRLIAKITWTLSHRNCMTLTCERGN